MTKLKDITGKALSGEWGTDDETGVGIPVLRTTNFTNEGIVNYENVVTRIITKKDISEKYLQSGDIIIEKSGGSDKQPVGRVIYFDGPENTYLFNNFTGLLRVHDKNEWFPRYVFYSLFANYKKGGTRPFENKTTGLHNLKTDDYVSRYEITEIPLNKQVAICAQLDQILKVINLRRKELSNLDDLIKARFVEMFGDPAGKMNNYPKKRFDELCENLDSKRKPITASVRESGNYPYYGASGIVDYVADYIFDEDILLVSEDGANLLMRSTPIAFSVSGKVWVNNHAHVVRFKNIYMQKYIEVYFSMIDISDQITGSAQPKLNQAKLNALEFALPEDALLLEYYDFVAQIDKSKLLSGCRLFHSWAPENRDKPKHVGVPRRRTKVLRGGRRQQ